MNLKNQRGITGIDISVSIFIIALFVTINVAIFYNASVNAKLALRNSEATTYMVQIAEAIQIEEYDNVVSDMNVSNVNAISGYEYRITVENPEYKYIENPEDIIKIVNIEIIYNVGSNMQTVRTRMIKAKTK